MKRAALVFALFVMLLPGAVYAQQQTGETVQGNLLQSGGGGLQQAPAGLQGSTPQIFGDSSKGSLLDQSNQKLLSDLGLSGQAASQEMEKQTEKSVPLEDSSGVPRSMLASLCLGLAGLASLFLLWLRRQHIS